MLVAACVAFTLQSGDVTASGSVLRIRNDSPQPWSLWMYSEQGRQWLAPTFLPRKQAVKVDLPAAGRVYLVLRDDGDRDRHLGWRDLHAAAEKLAGPPDGVAELALSTRLVTEQREEAYAVETPVQETRVRTVVVDGVEREIEETVTVMVPRMETRVVSVSTEIVAFSGMRDGEPVDLDDVGAVAAGLENPPPPPARVGKAAAPGR